MDARGPGRRFRGKDDGSRMRSGPLLVDRGVVTFPLPRFEVED